MSILEQKTFLTSIHPFENLTKSQLEEFASNIDIVYFKKNEIIQEEGKEPGSDSAASFLTLLRRL